jgi:hypothetical protein
MERGKGGKMSDAPIWLDVGQHAARREPGAPAGSISLGLAAWMPPRHPASLVVEIVVAIVTGTLLGAVLMGLYHRVFDVKDPDA